MVLVYIAVYGRTVRILFELSEAIDQFDELSSGDSFVRIEV